MLRLPIGKLDEEGAALLNGRHDIGHALLQHFGVFEEGIGPGARFPGPRGMVRGGEEVLDRGPDKHGPALGAEPDEVHKPLTQFLGGRGVNDGSLHHHP